MSGSGMSIMKTSKKKVVSEKLLKSKKKVSRVKEKKNSIKSVRELKEDKSIESDRNTIFQENNPSMPETSRLRVRGLEQSAEVQEEIPKVSEITQTNLRNNSTTQNNNSESARDNYRVVERSYSNATSEYRTSSQNETPRRGNLVREDRSIERPRTVETEPARVRRFDQQSIAENRDFGGARRINISPVDSPIERPNFSEMEEFYRNDYITKYEENKKGAEDEFSSDFFMRRRRKEL